MPRAGLSSASVVALALDVVDDEGWDALTLAAVATRAGVAVPSLYKHVAGLPALRREVASVCVDELTDRLADARGALVGAPAVLAMAQATRDLARQHPGRYQAAQGDWPLDPAADELRARAVRAVELMSAAVGELDVPTERRVDAVRAVRAAVHGFVTLELAGGFGMPQDVDTSFDYLVTHLTTGLTAHPAA